MNLIDKLKNLINNMESNLLFDTSDNSLVLKEMVNVLFNHTDGNLLTFFMIIDKLSKDKRQKELNEMYQGLQDGMHSQAMLSRHLLEDKTSKQAKDFAKFYFNYKDGDIASLINIAKAYFKDGTANGASNSGHWWFEQFVKILKSNKDKYLEKGSSYKWACNYNHIDYIKLVLSKN